MTPRQRRRSINYAVIGAVWAVVGMICTGGPILNLAALKLDAGEAYIGVLNFLMMSTWCFRAFTMSAVERHGKRRVMFFWLTVSALCVSGFLLIPYLANHFSTTVCLSIMLLTVFLRGATYALGDTGWFPILQDIVPRQITGRFFANLRTSWQTACLVTLLFAAWFLGKNPDWWKFEIIFAFAMVALVIRVVAIIPMVEIPTAPAAQRNLSILARFREVIQDKTLRRVVLYLSVFIPVALATEPFKIKYLKDLGYSDGTILMATAMLSLGAIASLRLWGKLADRFGNHSIFTISHYGMPLATLLWIFVGKGAFGHVLAFSLFFFWSVFFSANGIAATRCVQLTVSVSRQNQINVINVIIGFTMGFGPLIAGLLLRLTDGFVLETPLRAFNNYHLLFIAASVLFVIPHILCKELKDPKEASTIEVLAIVTRPVLNIFGPFLGIRRNGPKDAEKS